MSKTLVAELQRTLNRVCGLNLATDGLYGRNTHKAANGVLEAVRQFKTELPGASVVASKSNMPPWLEEMTRRMGLHEVRDNEELSEWLKDGKYLGDPSKLPWCGDAVETAIIKTLPNEEVPASPFWAQAWRTFGEKLDEPEVGAIGVIKWSAKAGHVGFVVDWSPAQIKMRGGNQSNAINDRWFPRNKFIAFRWPETFPFHEYPKPKSGSGKGGGLASTR